MFTCFPKARLSRLPTFLRVFWYVSRSRKAISLSPFLSLSLSLFLFIYSLAFLESQPQREARHFPIFQPRSLHPVVALAGLHHGPLLLSVERDTRALQECPGLSRHTHIARAQLLHSSGLQLCSNKKYVLLHLCLRPPRVGFVCLKIYKNISKKSVSVMSVLALA